MHIPLRNPVFIPLVALVLILPLGCSRNPAGTLASDYREALQDLALVRP